MQYLALCIAILFSCTFAQTPTEFQATFTSYNDPLISGIMTGTINYDMANNQIRNDYNIAGGIIEEYFNFTQKLRYLYCSGVCDAQTYTVGIPMYQSTGLTSTGNVATISGVTCTEYTVTNNPVAFVWTAANGLVCRAVWAAPYTKTIDFANWAPLNTNTFSVINTWGCPVPQCNRQMDIVMILDESGSITPPNFVLEKNFGISVASQFTFGPSNVGMALVQFASYGRITIPMSYNQQSFLNAMNAVFQEGGATCIGCGLLDAESEIQAHGRGAGVQGVFILLTDGMINVDVAQFPGVLAAAKQTYIIIAIGVGPLVDVAEINEIASSPATSFPGIVSFSALSGILNSLIAATCAVIPATPCGVGCQGFCSCKGNCICPSSCNNSNICQVGSCTNGVQGSGCTYTPVVCNNGNLCQTGSCNVNTGCQYTNITCTSPDICHTSSCNPAVGCQFFPVNCNLNSPCFADSCNVTAGGCVHMNITCNKCFNPVTVTCPQQNCYNSICNGTTGTCQATPINCDDGNACTLDSCNTATGQCQHSLIVCNDNNMCTHKYCSVTTGCYYVPYNATDITDNNVCTNDSCDPVLGIQHINITCPNNNSCLTAQCNYLTGCYTLPIDCLSIPRIAHLLGTCYEALCSQTMNGCYLNQLPGTTIDSCGVCNGNNQCVVFPLPSNVPYVIGGALLAVIVVGSVVLGGAALAFGGKKGYDIWVARRNNMSGASTNPLYNDNGMTGRNPMYSDRATRV